MLITEFLLHLQALPSVQRNLRFSVMHVTHLVHDIQARILSNGTIGRDYSSHTSSESLTSLDFKSN